MAAGNILKKYVKFGRVVFEFRTDRQTYSSPVFTFFTLLYFSYLVYASYKNNCPVACYIQ